MHRAREVLGRVDFDVVDAVQLCFAYGGAGKPWAIDIPVVEIPGINTQFKCYPNPATSYVILELPDNYVSKNYSLQVYSFTGKKMYETNITNPKVTITFSNQYYRGIYVYQLRDMEGKVLETNKFQVNR